MCDNCDKEPEFVISETTNMTQRVDTYIKQDVGEEEYMCSNKAANLNVAPKVIAYDKARRSMVTEAGTVLDSFPEEVSDTVADDIAQLAVKIAKAGLRHNDFHAGNMVYINNNRLVAIDWEDCPSEQEDHWITTALDMIKSFIRYPWMDQKSRENDLTNALKLDIDEDERADLRQRLKVLKGRKQVFSKQRKKVLYAFEDIVRQETGNKSYKYVDPLIAARQLARQKIAARKQLLLEKRRKKMLSAKALCIDCTQHVLTIPKK